MAFIQTPQNAVDPSERHRGERDAIALALEINADAILLDEKSAREHAQREKLIVTGTIGVLERAANAGFISDLAALHQIIRRQDFHVSEKLLADSLQRHLSQHK